MSVVTAVLHSWGIMAEAPEQPLIKALVTNDVVDFPHNDLENAAWFLHERISRSFEQRERPDGIFLDMIALVTMTSFALEGYANALGWRWLRDDPKAWKAFEWSRVTQKIETLTARYGLAVDWSQRPFSTVEPLIALRNMFAHPKAAPAADRERLLIGRHNDFVKLLRDHKPEYEKALTWEFADQACQDVDAIWHLLVKASGLNPFDLQSGGSQGFELLAHIGPDGSETPAR